VHGLVFTSFVEFLAGRPDAATRDPGAEPPPPYRATEAYPDEEFRDLLERASRTIGVPTSELLREFGVYAANVSFAALYPAYYAESADTRSFLLAVEDRIHELVRTTLPGARPPRLNVRPLGERGVCITYTSERGLCALLEGLVAGTARYYGETFEIEEIMCMRDGGLACTFLIQPA
jgi:predicted hydrocarbon binding protein